jgi:peptidoglycan/xylan/chitin deacetylase (PgdA/CDA1 family)
MTEHSRHDRPGIRAILTYHSIDSSGSVISLDVDTLARHAQFLSSGKVRVLPLTELVQDSDPGDAVALTFDDGFANFASEAWPRLRDHGLPATVFVVTERVGRDNRWQDKDDPIVPTLPLLDWDQIGRLADEGVEIGSHSRSHPRLERIGRAQLSEEVAGSADDIEQRIGHRPTTFCYPFGGHDDGVVAAVEATYGAACTTELRVLGQGADPHQLPRLDCYYFKEPGLLEQWGSRRFSGRIRARAALRATRAAVTRG